MLHIEGGVIRVMSNVGFSLTTVLNTNYGLIRAENLSERLLVPGTTCGVMDVS